MTRRKKEVDVVSPEVAALQNKKEHAKEDKQRKEKNGVKEQWYEVYAGKKQGDKKVRLKTRMEDGQVHSELYCNAKRLANGKRNDGFAAYDELIARQKAGEAKVIAAVA